MSRPVLNQLDGDGNIAWILCQLHLCAPSDKSADWIVRAQAEPCAWQATATTPWLRSGITCLEMPLRHSRTCSLQFYKPEPGQTQTRLVAVATITIPDRICYGEIEVSYEPVFCGKEVKEARSRASLRLVPYDSTGVHTSLEPVYVPKHKPIHDKRRVRHQLLAPNQASLGSSSLPTAVCPVRGCDTDMCAEIAAYVSVSPRGGCIKSWATLLNVCENASTRVLTPVEGVLDMGSVALACCFDAWTTLSPSSASRSANTVVQCAGRVAGIAPVSTALSRSVACAVRADELLHTESRNATIDKAHAAMAPFTAAIAFGINEGVVFPVFVRTHALLSKLDAALQAHMEFDPEDSGDPADAPDGDTRIIIPLVGDLFVDGGGYDGVESELVQCLFVPSWYLSHGICMLGVAGNRRATVREMINNAAVRIVHQTPAQSQLPPHRTVAMLASSIVPIDALVVDKHAHLADMSVWRLSLKKPTDNSTETATHSVPWSGVWITP